MSESDGARTIGRQFGWLPNWDSWNARADQPVPGWAIISAAATPLILTAGFLTAGGLQPDTYNPMRQTVSLLAGYGATDRWVMTGTLFLVGGSYLVTAAGLSGLKPPARLLLVLAGLCSVGIATSPEPAAGPTAIHIAWTVMGAATIAIWPAVAGWHVANQHVILAARGCAVATLVFVILLAWTIMETQGGGYLGLAERMTSSVQTTWPLIVAVALRRERPQRPSRLGEIEHAEAVQVDAVQSAHLGYHHQHPGADMATDDSAGGTEVDGCLG